MDAIGLFDARGALDLEETWVLDIDDAVFTARIAHGCVEASCGAAEDADAAIKTDMETFYWLVARWLGPADALDSGRITVDGDPGVLDRLVRVLNFAPRVGGPPPLPV